MKILVLLLFLSGICFAQDSTYTYVNKRYKACNQSDATYLQKVVKGEDDFYRVERLFLDSVLYMTGVYYTEKLMVKHGVFKFYYNDSALESMQEWEKGNGVGIHTYYSKKGKLVRKKFFEDGKFVRAETYWPDETLQSEGFYRGGIEDSLWTYYHLNGEISSKCVYDKGNIIDETCYSESGVEEQCLQSVEPQFPGGEAAMMQWIANHVEYPEEAIKNGYKGIVYVQFVVDIDGSTDDIKVVRGVHESINNEAIRIIGKMPKWIPATQHNRPVRVRYTLPINFRL